MTYDVAHLKSSNYIGQVDDEHKLDQHLVLVDKDLQNLFNESKKVINYTGKFALVDTDGDTKVQVEESADEDIIRFDTGPTAGGSVGERATIDYNGIALTDGLRVTLDGRTGNDYIKYNNSSEYMEFYLAGALRMEI